MSPTADQLWQATQGGGAQDVSHAASGGMVCGGGAAISVEVSVLPIGGALLGGDAAETVEASMVPAGGALFGGDAEEAVEYAVGAQDVSHEAAGGMVCGGSAAVSREINAPASEQPQVWRKLSPLASLSPRCLSVEPSGGVVLGGSAEMSIEVAHAAAGGMVFGGSAVIVAESAALIDGISNDELVAALMSADIAA